MLFGPAFHSLTEIEMTGIRKHAIAFCMVPLMAIGLASCSTADRDAGLLGGAAGAIIGGASTGTVKGAAVGGAIGAGAGVLIGRVFGSRTDCYYRDRRGRRYVDRCR